MRLAIEIQVAGATIAEIVEKATDEWNRISGKNEETLPTGCEIDIAPSTQGDSAYSARVFVRTKVENQNG